MQGERLVDEAKVMGVVGGLRINTNLWKTMNIDYPKSYAEFRHRAGNLISSAELLAQRMEDQGTNDANKLSAKLDKPYRKLGATYKAPWSFKPFDDGSFEVKLLEVLIVAPDQVYNAIKARQHIPPPRKMQRRKEG